MKKNQGNIYLAEITYLRIKKGITFIELAKRIGVSTFWLRTKIKEGNQKYLEKARAILES